MKKLLSLILALAMTVSFCACGQDSDEDVDEDEDEEEAREENDSEDDEDRDEPNAEEDATRLAKEYIANGQIQKAYDLLSALEDPTKNEKTMLDSFVFRLTETTGTDGTVTTYFYDEKGNILKDERVYPYGTRHISNYDEKGNVTTEQSISDGKTTEYKNIYDDQGHCVEYQRKGKGGQWLTYVVFTYDDHGNWLTQESYSYHKDTDTVSDAPSIVYTYSYTYDEKGNILTCETRQVSALDGSVENNREVYTYDGEGKRIKMEFYRYDSFLADSVTEYTYDENGLLTTAVITRAFGDTDTTTYTYQLFYTA